MGSMSIPNIGQESVDSIFTSLSKMEVQLDADPLSYGPRRLNLKISQARGMLTDCESLFLKVSHWLQKYRVAQRSAAVTLDLEKKNLFTNDPEVRAGRNFADRDAIASMMLKSEVEELSKLESALDDLETLLTVIKAKRSDMRDVQGRIRDQIKLCQEEIGLGARWGSKLPPGVEVPNLDDAPPVDKTTLRDLQDMFTSQKPVAIVEHVETNETLEDLFSTSSSSEESDAFLSQIDGPKHSEVDDIDDIDDIEDILKGFDI